MEGKADKKREAKSCHLAPLLRQLHLLRRHKAQPTGKLHPVGMYFMAVIPDKVVGSNK